MKKLTFKTSLASEQYVQISIYTSTLKIECQDTELAFYTMEWVEDNKHIKE